ncbi:hypothetical protein [Acidithiobacillus thiooxidans]|uniref:hypothetical protein n=1 Tax=Acidithiobacillus thiooxidans TaxID=930 RepID=UPI0035653DFC
MITGTRRVRLNGKPMWLVDRIVSLAHNLAKDRIFRGPFLGKNLLQRFPLMP